MSETTPPRKPPVGSRTPTSRPRRVAGSPTPPPERAVDSPDPDLGEPEVGALEARDPEARDPEAGPEAGALEAGDPEAAARGNGRLTRLRLGLVALVVVLLVVGTAEVVVITRHESPEDRPVGRVSAEQPVQLDQLTVSSVVDQAGQAAVLIGSASWRDYDAGVEAAAATMTDPFAQKYRDTKGDVKDQVVAQKVEVTVEIDAKGVVSATPDEVVALLFLTQSTIAGTGAITPRQYRATVTMVKADNGWLVGALDAGDALDITGDAG